MPAVEVFLDSNVLVYALSDAREERAKRERALELIMGESFGTSYQVLMETWVVAVRKMERSVAAEKVGAFLERILCFPCLAGSAELFRRAFLVERRYGIHPYDAAIVAAAEQLGAGILYSEDMNHGQRYGGVVVKNPFHGLAFPK